MYSIRNGGLFRNLVWAFGIAAVCHGVATTPAAWAGDGYALEVNGSRATINDAQNALRLSSYTYELWLKDLQGPTGSWRNVFCKGMGSTTAGRGPLLALRPSEPGAHFDHSTGSGQSALNMMEGVAKDEWVHIALVLTASDGEQRILRNGEQAATRAAANVTATTQEPILRLGLGARVILDDFRVWNYARTAEEIKAGMSRELKGSEEGLVGYWKFNEGEGTIAYDSSPSENHGTITSPLWSTDTAPVTFGPPPAYAYAPFPAAGAADVPHDAVLSWKPGQFAGTHDVYFGTTSEDVGHAGRTDPRGVLVSQGQDPNAFDPGPLEYGQTYYWRIDEVNAAPDSTVHQGSVWSFTVEPYSYPIANVSATASSFNVGMGPENTVNGSGLNAGDQHSTEATQMWLSNPTDAQPAWIQFEFDDVYKLDQVLVWNSNQLLEGVLGFGVKEAAVEYSEDGVQWATLGDVTIARAPGAATYTPDAAVDLGGIFARHVRLAIKSNWGGLMPQYGLSEVRFFQAPVRAREPQPATGETGVDLDVALTWRPGRDAISHRVSFGTDPAAVADGSASAQRVTEHEFAPAPLDFGTTYYWKVDELGHAGSYEGELWNFTTREYASIEDFESYDDEDNRIYQAWVDGVTTGASGSTVGYLQAPFAERTIIHGGRQSMPFQYNNADAPFYSEAEREFATAQNWTGHGTDTLSLWVRGLPAAFVQEGDAITMSGAGHDIWDAADDFRFAYKTLTGDGSVLVKVESLLNTNNWAKAGVMIRQSLDADSKFVYFIQSYAQGVSLGWRATTAAAAASVPATAGITAPQWVKLTRKGDVFTAQYSANGATWTDLKVPADGTIASTTVAMTNPVYIGLCVTSHNTNATTVAQMSGAATTGNVAGGAWQVLAIGDDPQPTNSAESLYLTIQDSANKSATVTNPTAINAAQWTEWRIPLSGFTGVNLSRVKKMIIGVGNKAAPAPGGTGTFYLDDISFGRPAGQ